MALCPIFTHALMSRSSTYVSEFAPPDGKYADKGKCVEAKCQMWNSQTKDCGLKQSPFNPVSKGTTLVDLIPTGQLKSRPFDAPPPASEPE